VSRILESNKEIEKISIEIKKNLDYTFNTYIYYLLLKKYKNTIKEEYNNNSCPLYKDLEEYSLKIKSFLNKKKNLLIKDNYYFKYLLLIIIYKYYKISNSYFSLSFIFRVLTLLFKKYSILIPSSKSLELITLNLFLREFLKKKYIKELNIKGIYTFSYIVFNS
jgi:hypothetical protein